MPRKNDAAGRIALVTGGTDGIGKEIALGLARRGYQILVIGRDAEKGAHAQNLLLANGAANARFLQADLALVHETRALAEKVASSVPALHVLVHCAGVVLSGRRLTAEGLERNFATNYLARFVLTQALLPLMQYGGGEAARIIFIGGAARGGSIFFDDVNLTRNFNLPRMIRLGTASTRLRSRSSPTKRPIATRRFGPSLRSSFRAVWRRRAQTSLSLALRSAW